MNINFIGLIHNTNYTVSVKAEDTHIIYTAQQMDHLGPRQKRSGSKSTLTCHRNTAMLQPRVLECTWLLRRKWGRCVLSAAIY